MNLIRESLGQRAALDEMLNCVYYGCALVVLMVAGAIGFMVALGWFFILI